MWVAIASIAALVTAGMNIYTYVTTGKQVESLITAVKEQSSAAADANRTLGEVLTRSQAQVDRLIDKLLP